MMVIPQEKLDEAEKIFTEKTAAYIQAAGLRAQANALFAKAAEEQAKGATAQFEDQTSFLDKAWSVIKTGGKITKETINDLAKEQAKGVKAEKARAAERADAISKEAQKLMELAETTENAAGIQSEAEKALAEEQKAAAKERADNAKASAEARAEAEKNEIDRIRELIISGEQLTNELAQKELDALYEKEVNDFNAVYKDRALKVQEAAAASRDKYYEFLMTQGGARTRKEADAIINKQRQLKLQLSDTLIRASKAKTTDEAETLMQKARVLNKEFLQNDPSGRGLLPDEVFGLEPAEAAAKLGDM
jgi:hypothetical protein